MEVNVNDLSWKHTKVLPATSKRRNDVIVSEVDWDNSVSGIIKDIANEIGMSYEQLKTVVDEKNKGYTFVKKCLFSKVETFSLTSPALNDLEKLLVIPDIRGIR